MTENAQQTVGLKPDEVSYELTRDEAFAYLKAVAPHGVTCAVCTQRNWSVSLSIPKGQGLVEGKVLPDGVLDAAELSVSGPDLLQKVLYNATRTYSFTCTNCGHQLRFSAGLVAARTALWKRDKK